MTARFLLGGVLALTLATCLLAQPPRLDGDGVPLPEHALFRLGSFQRKHLSRVLAVHFTADGKAVTSVSDNADGRGAMPLRDTLETHVWEVATGKELPGRRGPDGPAKGVLSPDGRWLVARDERTCTLRDPITGRRRYTLAGQVKQLEAVSLSADGKRLVTADSAGRVCVWEAASGKLLHALSADAGNGVALSSDGEMLAVGSSRGLVLWRVGKEQVTRLKLGRKDEEAVPAAAFAPDGKTLAALHDPNDPTLCLWDVATGKLREQAPLPQGYYGIRHSASYLGFAPDRTFYRIDATETERVVRSVFTGQVVCRVASPDAELRTLAFSPDGSRLATAEGCAVRIWDTRTGKELHAPPWGTQTDPLTSVHYLPNGRLLTSDSRDRATLWDAQTGAFLRSFALSGAAALADATVRLAAFEQAGTLFLVRDLATDRVLLRQPFPRDPALLRSTGFSPSEQLVGAEFFPFGRDALVWELHVWHLGTLEKRLVRVPLELGKNRKPLHCSSAWQILADDRTLVTRFGPRTNTFGSWAGLPPEEECLGETVLHFWEIESGKRLSTLRLAPGEAVHSGAGVAGGLFRVTLWTEGRRLRSFLWDIKQGKQVAGSEQVVDRPRRGWVRSPDGKLVATCEGERATVIVLYEVANGKPVRTLRGFQAEDAELVFSPDGQLLAAYTRSEAHLFAVTSGEHLGTLINPRGALRHAAFAPDSCRLATCATETTTLVWDLSAFRKKLPR